MEGQEEYKTEEPISDIEDEVETPQDELGEAGDDATTALTLYDQMAKTWKLPIDDLMLLVNPPPKGTLTIPMMQRVRAASMQYGIPIPGFNFIPAGKAYSLYINAAGIQFRLSTDPRGLESVVTTIEHMPDLSSENDYISVRATIKMKEGSYAEDWGISEWPPTGRNRQLALGDLTMKLATKAIRRASTRLVGTTLPVYDEDFHAWIAGRGKDIVNGEYEVIKPKPKKTEPVTLSDLLSMTNEINEDWDADWVVELMGMELGELNTPENIKKAWETIQERIQDGRETDEEAEVSEETDRESEEQVS